MNQKTTNKFSETLVFIMLIFALFAVLCPQTAIVHALPQASRESEGFGDIRTLWTIAPPIEDIVKTVSQTTPLIEVCGDGIDDNSNGQIDEECNLAPDCSTTSPDPAVLLFPDRHMEDVVLKGTMDPNGDAIALVITDVIQDEPTNGLDGTDQGPDAVLIDGDTVQLRAERAENGDGRIFYISFQANDGRGGVCDGVVSVSVPIDQRLSFAVDSGTYFSSRQ